MTDISNEQWQAIIDQLVDYTLGVESNKSSGKIENVFCNAADSQGYPWGKVLTDGGWIRDDDIPDLSELRDWASYRFDEDLLEGNIFDEERLAEFTEGSKPKKDEYKIFLAWWVVWCMDHHDWSVVPVYDLQEMVHSDGRSCILALSSTEGGQGGTLVSDQLFGFFSTKEEALGYFEDCGILDIHIEDKAHITKFVDRVYEEGFKGYY
jgi:hypothetical protein